MWDSRSVAKLKTSTLALLLCRLAAVLLLVGGLENLAGMVNAQASEDPDALKPELAKSIVQSQRFAMPSGWQWHYMTNGDGAKLRYGFCAPPNSQTPSGTVVILPGFIEFGEVYFELAKEFLRRGYLVYELDWRGSGGSERYFVNSQKNSSLGIEHDVDDLHQFFRVIVRKHSIAPLILVAHSLGSHIALRYLYDHPQSVDMAVLSAPPLSAGFGSMPPWAVGMASAFQLKMKHGNEYVTGQGDWTIMASKVSKMRSHSHDPTRSKLEYAWATENPSLQVGGLTWRGLNYFWKSCNDFGSDDARKITTPILIGCPTEDHIANPEEMRELAKKLPNATLFEAKDARHELFLEDDTHRQPWMDAVFKFIQNKRSSKPTS